jgi:hypothetical protein
MLSRNRYQWAAFILALLGQFSFAFGVPLPVIEGADSAADSSSCACCPAQRSSNQCCCQKFPPGPEKHSSCCGSNQARSEEPTQLQSQPTTVKLKWHAGIFQQKCDGPLGSSSTNAGVLAVSPEPPVAWAFESPEGERLSLVVDEFQSLFANQPTPPPRPLA